MAKRKYCNVCEGSGRPGMVRYFFEWDPDGDFVGYEDCLACGDGGRSFLDEEGENEKMD
jgi:hypothetical protein